MSIVTTVNNIDIAIIIDFWLELKYTAKAGRSRPSSPDHQDYKGARRNVQSVFSTRAMIPDSVSLEPYLVQITNSKMKHTSISLAMQGQCDMNHGKDYKW
jgi:hypothetical protein